MFPTFTCSVVIAALFVVINVVWTWFLIYDANHNHPNNKPSRLASIGLLCHAIPSVFLLATVLVAQEYHDSTLVWLISLLAFRYWRTIINIFFWCRYKPTVATDFPDSEISSDQCTVIVPTVGPKGNQWFGEMVAAILVNNPARIIFSTNTEDAANDVQAALPDIQARLIDSQSEYGPNIYRQETIIDVLNADISNKRAQVVHAIQEVVTKFLVNVDDTAIWHPQFLEASLPAFGNEDVGFVGTRKWVKRVRLPRDPAANVFMDTWRRYKAGFWNTIGGLYLIRHNFEIRATSAADGGVFCVSGRSSLIRTEIVKNDDFADAFLNEYVLRLGNSLPAWFFRVCPFSHKFEDGWGPVKADDDNFITRWVLKHGYEVKIQYSSEATMKTALGGYPLKFPDQCMRWSRTTFRQNPIALFADRVIWWKWPLTVWTTYFPWLYNAALFWDGLAVYTLTRTDMYNESSNRIGMLCGLVVFIWMTKLVKTIPWFWEYPADFFLYFLIPAYPLFAYWHSCLKVYTACTFWDLAWSGRKLPVK
jgi:hypothetical protein